LAASRTVLVIDDEEPIRRVVELKLRNAGYNVLTAEDGERGLRLIREHNPEVVISDVRMPRMGGKDLCAAINALKRDRPFLTILLTGSVLMDEEEWVKELDQTEWMEKPFSPAALLARVDRHFGIQRRASAAR